MSETEKALAPPAEAKPTRVETIPSSDLEKILQDQFQTLRVQHTSVLQSEDPIAIHKMRVTTRRIQASLDLLEGPHDQLGVRNLKKTLRRARRMLSLVRNYDVFLELLERDASGGRPALSKPYTLVAEALRPRRQNRMVKAKRHLSRLDIERIASRLGLPRELAATADETSFDVAASDPVPDAVPAAAATDENGLVFNSRWIALHAADRLDQRLAEFHIRASEAHPTTDPHELHQLRIAAKRVRYLFEVVSAMGYGDARRSLTWLRSLQDRIGEWHDVDALQDEIASIVTQPLYLKQHLAEAKILLEAAVHLQRKKSQLVGKLFPVRVPRMLMLTGTRLSRSLRRSAQDGPARRAVQVQKSTLA